MNVNEANNQITTILMAVLGVMLGILLILIVVYITLKLRERAKVKERIKNQVDIEDPKKIQKEMEKEKLKHVATQLDKRSIQDFMEFEKIQDNMIIVKERKKYLMVVECKGVNYDLMSEAEKIGVEEGFQQFLNTLRHPIQIYIQTRTINLENSIERYNAKVKAIEQNYRAKEYEYRQLLENPARDRKQLQKAAFELTRQRNLLEYGKDVIANTEKMSMNKSVLNKSYYVIIPYYVEEVGSDKYFEEEILNTAFSELYTKAQSIIRTLSSCYVTGRVLNSRELIELLYVAYNRDDFEVMGTEKLLLSGYNDLYSTGIDVFEKKIALLDEEIKKKAVLKANNAIEKVKSKMQEEAERKEQSVEELARKMAAVLIDQNRGGIGVGIARKAIEEINKEGGKANEKEEQAGK